MEHGADNPGPVSARGCPEDLDRRDFVFGTRRAPEPFFS